MLLRQKFLNTIKTINKQLHDKNEELERAYLDTIGILRQTVEAKDPYTKGHSDRVSEYEKNHPDGSVRLWQAGNEGKDNADIFLSIQDPELP